MHKMQRRHILLAFAVVLHLIVIVHLLHAQNQPAPAAAQAPAGDAARGKKLYNDIGCWQCHGYSGQGGAGAKIAPDPLPLAGFTRYVRKPVNAMPPYSEKVVTDAQLADIYAFLKSVPKPPDAKSIPLLNQQ
jgi:mono/diheme cytochrome c family protein